MHFHGSIMTDLIELKVKNRRWEPTIIILHESCISRHTAILSNGSTISCKVLKCGTSRPVREAVFCLSLSFTCTAWFRSVLANCRHIPALSDGLPRGRAISAPNRSPGNNCSPQLRHVYIFKLYLMFWWRNFYAEFFSWFFTGFDFPPYI